MSLEPAYPHHADAMPDVVGSGSWSKLAPTPKDLIAQYVQNGPTFALSCDEGTIAIGGVAILWPGVGEAWVLASSLAAKYPVRFVRGARQVIETVAKEYGLWRMQTHAICSRPQAKRLSEMLGFEEEAVMRAFSPTGEDCWLMRKIWRQPH